MKYKFLLLFSLFFLKGISQNNFDNGDSPSVFRYFHEYQSIPGYNQFIFQVEGMDAINYFGSRLTDLTNDGKIDVIYRAKEHLEGDWDFASTEPRPFIHLNIDNNFEGHLIKDTQHLFTGPDLLFHENENGEKFYYNYSDMDPTIIDEIGVDDFRQYLENYNFIEGRDYIVLINSNGSDYIEWIPRIIKISGNTRIDVTHEYLELDDELQNSNQQYPWDQTVGIGDYDGDGDEDVLMIGIANMGDNPNFTNHDDQYSKMGFYFMENQGDGKLISSMYSYIPSNGEIWTVEHGVITLVSNFDDDPSDELLFEMRSFNSDNTIETRKLGYLNINKENKSVEFVDVLNAEQYLYNPEWSMGPRHYKSVSYNSYPDREFIMTLVTSLPGSPPVRLDGNTNFTDGVVQQYFKVFEKVFDGSNNGQLIDRTTLFFDLEESKTLSMDNSGSYHFIDIDNDGDLDIFPQFYQGPNESVGGIDQFLNYPNWCGDPNSICFFKNVGDRYELTTYNSIKGLYPTNFNFTSDYTLFDDNGVLNSGGKEYYMDDFFIGNRLSVNDINKDGEHEFITSSNPDFLTIFTKSNVVPSPEVFNLNLDYQTVQPSDWSKLSYNHEGNNFYLPKDTINIKYDTTYYLKFLINDNEQLLSHNPTIIDVIDPETIYTSTPTDSYGGLLNSPTNVYEIDFMNNPNRIVKFTSISNPILSVNFRKGNDIYMKQFPVITINENINPFPFELISIDSSNPSLLSLSFNSSFDYNQNYHQGNSNYNVTFREESLTSVDIPGPKYGYRIIQNGTTSEVVNDVSYDINYRRPEPGSDNYYIVDNFNIDISEYQNTEFEYEVFAIDTEDSSLTTIMKKTKFLDSDGDGIMDDVDTCSDTPTGETVNSTGCSTAQLSVDDEKLDNSLKLYPNPVTNILTIESKNVAISKVEIYSILGEKIKEINSNFGSITTDNLPNGIYIIRIYSEKGMVMKKTIKM